MFVFSHHQMFQNVINSYMYIGEGVLFYIAQQIAAEIMHLMMQA